MWFVGSPFVRGWLDHATSISRCAINAENAALSLLTGPTTRSVCHACLTCPCMFVSVVYSLFSPSLESLFRTTFLSWPSMQDMKATMLKRLQLRDRSAWNQPAARNHGITVFFCDMGFAQYFLPLAVTWPGFISPKVSLCFDICQAMREVFLRLSLAISCTI